jgi:hypothetical protein
MRFLEQRQAQNLQNSVEIGLEIEALSDDRHQDVDRDGDPYLGFDGVFGGAEERFDPQVLFDPFEKQTATNGTYHAFKFAKYAPRYLVDFQYRFNRRYNLRSILPRLLRAAATTAPWTEQRLGLAEFRA